MSRASSPSSPDQPRGSARPSLSGSWGLGLRCGERGLIRRFRRFRSACFPGQVCLSDLNPTTGEAALKELRAKFGEDRVAFIPCDVLKASDLVALYDGAEEHFGAKVQLAAARWRCAPPPGGRLL